MAVAATSADTVCRHEPGYGDYEGAAAIWSAEGRIGISDAGLGMHLPRILAEIGPRTLIIQRDPEQVVASYAAYASADIGSVRAAVAEKMSALIKVLDAQHPLIRHVRFEALSDIATVRDCLNWLGVHKPLNLEGLMNLNIQSDFGFNLAKVQALAAA